MRSPLIYPGYSEHLNVLEADLADRNSLIKASQDEIRRLRDENDEREYKNLVEMPFKAHSSSSFNDDSSSPTLEIRAYRLSANESPDLEYHQDQSSTTDSHQRHRPFTPRDNPLYASFAL